ncbi:MAG: ABC transporter ATP-binding protein [Bdellovibrionaceae bacterium]|nr:ABC transporter ATP-binding protein [Pseudobdellovibrionaceae bacterium]
MLEYRNVKKSFGRRTVLDGVTLSISSGEIVFILGTSGTGKSVLLKNTVGLMRPDAGEIWVDGQEVTQLSEEDLLEVRRKCGMVFQQPALFDSLTVYENIAFGIRRHLRCSEAEVQERVSRALSLVRLKGVEEKKPNQISYGMQKRVSLARTVALEPKILLFDEPTTGLDPVTTTAINQLILRLSRTLNTTSVVVSHDMKCALDIADRIVVLGGGKILALGTPQQMMESDVPLVKEFLAEVVR